MKALIVLLPLIMGAGCAMAQREQQSTEAFIGNLRELRNQVSDIDCKCQTQVDSLVTTINKGLINADAGSKPIPLAYQNAINDFSKMAVMLKDQPDSVQKQALGKLLIDFKLKFEFASDNVSTESLFKLIEVEVETREESAPANNLSVHYAALGYVPNYENPIYTFRGQTSPAKEMMVPGFYRIWITRPGETKVLGEKMTEVDPAKRNKITVNVHLN